MQRRRSVYHFSFLHLEFKGFGWSVQREREGKGRGGNDTTGFLVFLASGVVVVERSKDLFLRSQRLIDRCMIRI